MCLSLASLFSEMIKLVTVETVIMMPVSKCCTALLSELMMFVFTQAKQTEKKAKCFISSHLNRTCCFTLDHHKGLSTLNQIMIMNMRPYFYMQHAF